MALWDDRKHNHDVHKQLEALGTELGKLAKSLPASAVPYGHRWQQVRVATTARLDSADSALVAPGTLDAITSAVSAARSHISGSMDALKAGDSNALASTDAQVDGIASALIQLPGLPAPEGYAEQLVATADDMLTALVEQHSRAADATTKRFDKLTTSTSSVSERLAAVESQLADVEQQASAARTAQQGAFDTQQTGRTKLFDEQLSKQRNDFDELVKTTKAQLDAMEGDTKKAFREAIADLGAKKAKAEEILGAIGATGMTAGYLKQAEEEKKLFKAWRLAAAGFGFLAVVSLAALIVLDHSGKLRTPEPSKIALALAITGLASYCAAQAGGHRKAERQARSLALAIASLAPYLTEVQKERRSEIVDDFAYEFFRPDRQGDEDGTHIFGHGAALARRRARRSAQTPT